LLLVQRQVDDMGRQESPQLIERKTQVHTDAQETGRASKYQQFVYNSEKYKGRQCIKLHGSTFSRYYF